MLRTNNLHHIIFGAIRHNVVAMKYGIRHLPRCIFTCVRLVQADIVDKKHFVSVISPLSKRGRTDKKLALVCNQTQNEQRAMIIQIGMSNSCTLVTKQKSI